MRGYYAYSAVKPENYEKSGFLGVKKKIDAQIAYLNSCGIECLPLEIWSNRDSLASKIRVSLPFTHDAVDWKIPEDIEKCDFIYVRYIFYCSKDFLTWLRRIKNRNPQIKILYELFTYPYDRDILQHPEALLIVMKDRHQRKKLPQYVDRIVNLANMDSIFGVPAIKMLNGIDVESISVRKPSYRIDRINIALVAQFRNHHAYDRVLCGLAEYHKEHKEDHLHLYFAGAGPAINKLRKLSKNFRLDDSVTFCGNLGKNELDELYDKCCFAISSLGLHRIGINCSTAIKIREYLAKGIPFVYSGKIDVFEKEPVDFCLRIPSDDTPVDFATVKSFIDLLYKNSESEEHVIIETRKYAKDNVDIAIAMKEVVNYLLSG